MGAVLAALQCSVAMGCGDFPPSGAVTVEAGPYRLASIPEPAPTVNRQFALLVQVCGDDGNDFSGALSFDASMPSHGHGSNYDARVVAVGPGRFRVEDVLLHMPGRWEFKFGLHDDEGVYFGRSAVDVR